MNTIVVTASKSIDENTRYILRHIGLTNITPVETHNDAIKTCAESSFARCFISENGASIGNQSLQHVAHEMTTIGHTSELVLLSEKDITSYVVTKDVAKSWVEDEHHVDNLFIKKACQEMSCEVYDNRTMKSCKGEGLFQKCPSS